MVAIVAVSNNMGVLGNKLDDTAPPAQPSPPHFPRQMGSPRTFAEPNLQMVIQGWWLGGLLPCAAGRLPLRP